MLVCSEVSKFNSKNLMASLDVDSLFTNIPLEETIDNIIKNLDQVNLIFRTFYNQLSIFKRVISWKCRKCDYLRLRSI